MLKINCEIIYDDKGMNIYYVDGMYLSGYSFYLYKMIKMLESRRPTRLMYTIDTSTIDKKLVEFKNAFDSFMSKDESTMVGPFFYIDDKIIAKTKSIGLFNDNLEFFDHELGHFDWFYNELVNELGLGKNADYGMYYRGRVLYDNKKGIYKVYSNPKVILDPKAFSQIEEIYNLKDKTVQFLVDDHYLLDNEVSDK